MTMNCRKVICYTMLPLCLCPAQWVYHPHGSPCQRQATHIPFACPFLYCFFPDLTPQHSFTSVHTAACAYRPQSLHICIHPPRALLYTQMNPCASFYKPEVSVQRNEPLMPICKPHGPSPLHSAYQTSSHGHECPSLCACDGRDG